MSTFIYTMKQIFLKSVVIFILLFVIIGTGKMVYTEPIYEEDSNNKTKVEENYKTIETPEEDLDIEENISEDIQYATLFTEEQTSNIENEEIKDTLDTNTKTVQNIQSEQQKEKPTETKEETIKNCHTVVIDAGHQRVANTDKEPIGPGALETKQKVSSGTQGISSHLPEYELTLDVALRLKQLLIDEGYEVIMIRETNDVNISNAERAEIANNSGADIFIRLHADGDENESVKGVTTLCPTENNEYCSEIAVDSYNLSSYIVDELSKETKDTNRGVSRVDNMTGINYCKIPVSIVEMGFMTNIETDTLFQTDEYKDKIATGILNGINKYFD